MWASAPLLGRLTAVSPRSFRASRTDRLAVLVSDDRFGDHDGVDFCGGRRIRLEIPTPARSQGGTDRRLDQARVDLVYYFRSWSCWSCSGGARRFTSQRKIRRRTRWRCSSPASSGCGRSSIPMASREINELHVPVGQPVKLTMASEDVIHSFSIPAFRVRHDVVPGHYDSLWFTATKPGRYHLFCTEYCGNQHARMIGWVDVMEARDYADWASGGRRRRGSGEQGQQHLRAERLLYVPSARSARPLSEFARPV